MNENEIASIAMKDTYTSIIASLSSDLAQTKAQLAIALDRVRRSAEVSSNPGLPSDPAG